MIFDDSFTKHVAFFTILYFPALLFYMNLIFESIQAVIIMLHVTRKEIA